MSRKTCAAAHGSDTLCRILGCPIISDPNRERPPTTPLRDWARLDNTRYPVSFQTNSYKFSPSFVEYSRACAFRYIHGGATYVLYVHPKMLGHRPSLGGLPRAYSPASSASSECLSGRLMAWQATLTGGIKVLEARFST